MADEKEKKEVKKEEKGKKGEKEDDLFTKKKIHVDRKEIPEDVQSMVADICLGIGDIDNPEKYLDVAVKIKGQLDKKFQAGWNVIIGSNFVGACSIAKNNLLEITISEVRILVFKSSAHAPPA